MNSFIFLFCFVFNINIYRYSNPYKLLRCQSQHHRSNNNVIKFLMVLITRLPTRSFNLALELILRFLLESTIRHMIAIQHIVYLSTRSIPKLKSTIHGLIKTWDSFKIKTQIQAQATDSRTFTIKSMTLRIHLLNNYKAGTCTIQKIFSMYNITLQYAQYP